MDFQREKELFDENAMCNSLGKLLAFKFLIALLSLSIAYICLVGSVTYLWREKLPP